MTEAITSLTSLFTSPRLTFHDMNKCLDASMLHVNAALGAGVECYYLRRWKFMLARTAYQLLREHLFSINLSRVATYLVPSGS